MPTQVTQMTQAPSAEEIRPRTAPAVMTVIAAFLVATLAFFNPMTASAVTKESEPASIPKPAMLESGDEEAKQAVEAASTVLENLPHGAVADLKNAHVSQPEGSDDLMVAVQLSGNGYDKGSFAGVVVDPETGRTTDKVQVRATQADDSEAQVTTWVNGNSQGTTTVDTSKDSADPQELEAQGADPDVIDCLNALGISAAVALIIISTCASACAVTVGVGCVACVAGFTAVGGASVGKCLST